MVTENLTEQEKQIIREEANITPLAELAKKINKSYKQVYDYLQSLPMSEQFKEHFNE